MFAINLFTLKCFLHSVGEISMVNGWMEHNTDLMMCSCNLNAELLHLPIESRKENRSWMRDGGNYLKYKRPIEYGMLLAKLTWFNLFIGQMTINNNMAHLPLIILYLRGRHLLNRCSRSISFTIGCKISNFFAWHNVNVRQTDTDTTSRY